MKNVTIAVCVLSILMLFLPTLSAFVPKAHASITSAQSDWQLREGKWYSSFPPNYSFSTPQPSILRVESTFLGAGGGYVFAVFNRADLDHKKLQVAWNVYWSNSDPRDLVLTVLEIFDQPFDRKDLSNYFAENIMFYPPYWNITCSCREALWYPGPLGAPAGWLGWRTDTTEVLDLSSWTSDKVTVLLGVRDASLGDLGMADLDWFKVLDSNDNEIYSYDFDVSVVMEVTNTYHDCGVLVSSEAPITMLAFQPSLSEMNCTTSGYCFSADIILINATTLYGYDVQLSYNSTLLDLLSVKLYFPAEWGSDYSIIFNQTTPGDYSLVVTALYPAPAFNGTMTLATLDFGITSAELSLLVGKTVHTNLTIEKSKLADSQATAILHGISNGTITLQFPLIGDINNDGIVDLLDVVKVAIAFGSHPGDLNWNPASDLNSDGTVDIIDIVIVAANYGRTKN